MRLKTMSRESEYYACLKIEETVEKELNLETDFARLESIRIKRERLLKKKAYKQSKLQFDKQNKPKNKGIY